MVGMQAQGWEPCWASKNHTSWAATYCANVHKHRDGHLPIPNGGGTVPHARPRRGGGDHWVRLPCFTDEETEAKRGQATCP